MTKRGPSEFRNAFQVSPERIATLDEHKLTELMDELLRAQGRRCEIPSSGLIVNAEENAKDDGCDAHSATPRTKDDWLGDVETCWQFKAGSAGQPSKLRGEVKKRIPRETLAGGGRLVVVANSSRNGSKGERDRRGVLVKEAKALGLPSDRIDVLGSERLANWCNQHPALAARFAGRPAGMWSLAEWLDSKQHRALFQVTQVVQAEISRCRTDLEFGGAIRHLHIQGPPGVGKSRFALELCRDAPWRDEVVYIPDAADVRLLEIIDGAAPDIEIRLVVIADESQTAQLAGLRQSIDRSDGRVRLVTVGHSATPDPVEIPAIQIRPLERQQMENVVKGWYPSLPPEHVEFVVRLADGYLRLARLTADAVARDSAIDVRGLMEVEQIKAFLSSLLGDANRRALHVVAVLTSVGWTDDVASEGEAIASLLSLDWSAVRADVEHFHASFGVAPKGGRYRYISPVPLAIYLAIEAWNAYPEQLKTLPDLLRTDEARQRYYDRLNQIASSPNVRAFALEQLSFFFRLNDFVDSNRTRRWAALSASDPAGAARNARQALESAPPDAIRLIADRARRELVSALVRLAWTEASFRDSTMALALLAESENESWANNATAEVLGRFQVFLGGTSVPYLRRLVVIDELLAVGRPTLDRLAVKALSRIGNRHEVRFGIGQSTATVPEAEWHPRGNEYLTCIETALDRLIQIAKLPRADLADVLAEAARETAMLLREEPLRSRVTQLYLVVRASHPNKREQLRRSVAELLSRERTLWKELSGEAVTAIGNLHAALQDPSLEGRLEELVGPVVWGEEERTDLAPLAIELLATPEALRTMWPWVTSGAAGDAWRLGRSLALADEAHVWDDRIAGLRPRGSDLRALGGFVSMRRQQLGDPWFDAWLRRAVENAPNDLEMLFQITRSCGLTNATIDLVVGALRRLPIESTVVGQVQFGGWERSLSHASLRSLVQGFVESGHDDTAVTLLDRRLEESREGIVGWEDLAIALVTCPTLIRRGDMAAYHWKRIAERLIPSHGREIVRAIFREQASRDEGVWFAHHHEASEILDQAAVADPEVFWEELRPYLADTEDAYRFTIGFPDGLIDRVPSADILAWVAEDVSRRGPIVAKVVAMNVVSDTSLAAQILGAFGDDDDVAGSFFGSYISGGWTGSSSLHWAKLADKLDDAAKTTRLAKLARWAERASSDLRRMSKAELAKEEEEGLP